MTKLTRFFIITILTLLAGNSAFGGLYVNEYTSNTTPVVDAHVISLSTTAALNVLTNAVNTNQISLVWYVSPTNSLTYEGTAQIFGLGTIMKPFYGDFDAIINAQPNYSVGILLPGWTNQMFWTRGNSDGHATNLMLKTGMQLIGFGPDQTIIKRDPAFAAQRSIYSTNSGVALMNLTIDGSVTNGFVGIQQGIILNGSYQLVRRVKVINWAGQNGGGEAWGVYLGAQSGTYGCESDGVVVSNCWGSYNDGIEVDGNANVHNCTVVMPVSTNSNHMVGYNYAYAVNANFVNDISFNGRDGAYADTGGGTNIIFSACHFLNAASGVYAHYGPGVGWLLQGMKIENCEFEATTNYWVSTRAQILLDTRETNVAWSGIQIIGNRIGWYNNQPPSYVPDQNQGALFALLEVAGSSNIINNVTIVGNQIDNRFNNNATSISAISGYWGADNVDQNGNSYSFFNTTATIPANQDSSLNAGRIIDISFNEGGGTNIHNFANGYGFLNSNPYSTCGIVGNAPVWSIGQLGYAESTTNSTAVMGSPPVPTTATNEITYSLNTNALNGVSNITISILFKQVQPPSSYVVPFVGVQGSISWLTVATPNNGVYTWIQTSVTNTGFTTVTTTPYTDGNWHQLIISYNGTTFDYWIDKVLVNSIAATGVISPTSGSSLVYLGAMQSGGAIGQFQLWNRTLNKSEIQGVFSQALPIGISTGSGFNSTSAHTPVAVTLGASPFNFTNTTPTALECYFSGSTAYSVSKNGTGVYGLFSGDDYFVLQPLSYCTVTYTVVPAMSTNSW